MSNEGCYCCDVVRGNKKPRGELVLDIGDGWVLNHFSAKTRNYLGRLVLAVRCHKGSFTELSEEEAQALGTKIRDIQKALRDYWAKAFSNDVLQRIYTVNLNEGEDHLHIHIFPRTKAMLWGGKKAVAVAAWELVHMLDKGFIPKQYRIFENVKNELKCRRETEIKELMKHLKEGLKAKTLH
jgi:diadenosine tetraphosphate (Ap4A) HIT family hydrolase